VSGRGNRQSVSDQGGAAAVASAATERRRSSAIDPAATKAAQGAHSGYTGGNGLAPIQSRMADEDEITSSSVAGGSSTSGAGANGGHGHTNFYDEVTKSTSHTSGRNGAVDHDVDGVAPDQKA
jgi:hypothetical protein